MASLGIHGLRVDGDANITAQAVYFSRRLGAAARFLIRRVHLDRCYKARTALFFEENAPEPNSSPAVHALYACLEECQTPEEREEVQITLELLTGLPVGGY